ncbi:DNA (cytosine-5-)-methyltransferase [Mangrovactinospora gilvigrisea]|uniref:DNA cytosine methyltransferase n=1 Tax=Mangrovactinospora gilvigrisea TaxID=1428644 RepID=UPI003012DD65
MEICAGAGGQAIGLHQAGFQHLALIEYDKDACKTLRKNAARLSAKETAVFERDLNGFTVDPDPKAAGSFGASALGLVKDGEVVEIDLLAGGVPCPPFSLAGKQLGRDDERDLFPVMMRMVEALRPKAVMIENVRGLLEPPEKFSEYRSEILQDLRNLGYEAREEWWKVLEARDFGVPQLRPRAILVAVRREYAPYFKGLPEGADEEIFTVHRALQPSMRRRYDELTAWAKENDEHSLLPLIEERYAAWEKRASESGSVAPTLVGGSKKHGGADLGPTRAKKAWSVLGVNGLGVADEVADANYVRHLLGEDGPMLTPSQAALIQGFPEGWEFEGRKTAKYRQVGNAFPPPVARAVGQAIRKALADAEEQMSTVPVQDPAGFDAKSSGERQYAGSR